MPRRPARVLRRKTFIVLFKSLNSAICRRK
uniref:Uncharacterized protein n=1 Tax=Arundo donax TaxID=35708 RepID=A0A0A9EZU1_ARUDO